jgi:hypothetical protein
MDENLTTTRRLPENAENSLETDFMRGLILSLCFEVLSDEITSFPEVSL